MRQLVFVGPGRVEWRDVPPPRLVDAGDALVRPLAVATCGLDSGLLAGRAAFPGPFPLGHEGVAEVVDTGASVTRIRCGDRVVVPFQVSCGTCDRCVCGRTASCTSVRFGAMYGLEPFGGPWGGFLADVVRVPWADHMLVPVPQALDPVTVASLSDNVPDGWRAVAPAVEDPPSASLLVVGSGLSNVHFYSIDVARAIGVARIDYIGAESATAEHADKAARLGATVLDTPADVRPRSYTATTCTATDHDAVRLALRATEPDGTCTLNGLFVDDSVSLPMASMYTVGVRLVTGRVNARAVLPAVLRLVESAELRPGEVTDDVVAWDDAAVALSGEPRKLVFVR